MSTSEGEEVKGGRSVVWVRPRDVASFSNSAE